MEQYSWSEVYRIALLELDSRKISERIALARKTIKTRMQEIPASATAEQRAIQDALNMLHVVEMKAHFASALPD